MRGAHGDGRGTGAGAAPATLVLALAVMATAGCDECDYGEVICRDNEVWTCSSTSAPLVWSRMPCGDRLCQVVTPAGNLPRGLCSVEAAPHAACATPTGRDRACADGRVVTCDSGFISQVLETCTIPDLCVARPVPFCAASLAPDPRCAAANVALAAYSLVALCDGGHLLRCAYPSQLLAEDTDCGGRDLCYTAPPSPGLSPTAPGPAPNPTCVVSRTPDPRCASTATTTVFAGRFSQTCDEAPRQDILINCLDGLLTSSRDCGASGCVHEAGYTHARCGGD